MAMPCCIIFLHLQIFLRWPYKSSYKCNCKYVGLTSTSAKLRFAKRFVRRFVWPSSTCKAMLCTCTCNCTCTCMAIIFDLYLMPMPLPEGHGHGQSQRTTQSVSICNHPKTYLYKKRFVYLWLKKKTIYDS